MKKSVKEEVRSLIKELNINCSVEEFIDKADWCDISAFKNISEEFIREFQNEVHWGCISESQKLSEGFIREFQNEVNWDYISAYQKLSENFIREFQNEVHWYYISKYQKISEEFIRKLKDKVHWGLISKYQKISENFIREFNLKIDPDNWLYKDKNFKLEKIKETGLYEFIDGDHILAYKGIRSDRYSSFNFQYQYLKGETYLCHCDCTSEENSFGLSAWTEEKAKEHCGELVIKVKINVEDIGRIVHNGGKLRCSKFTVLD